MRLFGIYLMFLHAPRAMMSIDLWNSQDLRVGVLLVCGKADPYVRRIATPPG